MLDYLLHIKRLYHLVFTLTNYYTSHLNVIEDLGLFANCMMKWLEILYFIRHTVIFVLILIQIFILEFLYYQFGKIRLLVGGGGVKQPLGKPLSYYIHLKFKIKKQKQNDYYNQFLFIINEWLLKFKIIDFIYKITFYILVGLVF